MDEVTRKSAEQFGRQAAAYVESAAHASGDSLGLLREWLAEPKSERVLDVATGAGHAALAAAASARFVVAYDLTAEMLREAWRLANKRGATLRYTQGLAETLPFARGTFDAVVCRVAAHHFGSPESFLAEAKRVIRDGGRVILIDTAVPDDEAIARWQNEVEKVRDGSHHRNRSLHQWREALLASGFQPLRSELQISHHTFRDWVARAATPPDGIRWLEQAFAGATPGIRDAFSIRRTKPDDYQFQWPVACVEGVVSP